MPRLHLEQISQWKETHNPFLGRTHIAVGIFYTRNPATGALSLLAEVQDGIQPGDKDLKLPGGHYEKRDKTKKKTLLREFHEECGVTLDADQLTSLTPTRNTYHNRRGQKRIIIASAFAMELDQQYACTPSQDEDIAGYEWVSPEEFKKRAQKDTYTRAIDGWLQEAEKKRTTPPSSFQTAPAVVPQL